MSLTIRERLTLDFNDRRFVYMGGAYYALVYGSNGAGLQRVAPEVARRQIYLPEADPDTMIEFEGHPRGTVHELITRTERSDNAHAAE